MSPLPAILMKAMWHHEYKTPLLGLSTRWLSAKADYLFVAPLTVASLHSTDRTNYQESWSVDLALPPISSATSCW